jgi:hypothetical protein
VFVEGFQRVAGGVPIGGSGGSGQKFFRLVHSCGSERAGNFNADWQLKANYTTNAWECVELIEIGGEDRLEDLCGFAGGGGIFGSRSDERRGFRALGLRVLI